MKPLGRTAKYLVLAFFFLVLPAIFLLLGTGEHSFKTLPYYGPREANAPGDTTYFTVPEFAFVDQDGQPFTQADVDGKIRIVDFFFTRCTTICPRMGAQMQQLQLRLDDPAYDDVLFLSHTVDPEHDTPEVLKEYAGRLEADPKRWKFLTGAKADIYLHGADGYFLASREDVMAPDGCLHSEMFVLVDREGHIRGYYDGTKTEEVDELLSDLKMLLKEEKVRAKQQAR